MAENNNFDSQESLPLSQESYQQLFRVLDDCSLTNMMNDALEGQFMNDQACDALVKSYINNNVSQQENNVQEQESQAKEMVKIEWGSIAIPKQHVGNENLLEQKRPVSSLPSSENWPGAFSFSVLFNAQTLKKGISWIFSKERMKLYVGKDLPCPVNFSTNITMPEGVFIRAMALFSCSDNASEVVKRCINHSMNDIQKNVFEAEHFIRCESQGAYYENDPATGRHSVIVPYENPPAGQVYSTYLYKFMCFGSCSGGPNRRPLMVVFTLERRGEVIGRQKIDLKVCACPMRDYKNDDVKNAEVQDQVLKENKPKRANTDPLHLMNLPKRIKQNEGKEEYIIKTSDKHCYIFLRKMKRLFTFYSIINSYYPGLRRLINTSSQSSSGEDTEGEKNN